MKRIYVLVILVILLSLAGSALAMSSESYRLDWFTLLNTAGGGTYSSENYTLSVTIGQTAVGSPSGTGTQACIGFWCWVESLYKILLPRVER